MIGGGARTGRMLILACSGRKRPDEGLLPAIERYDGPAFRVLRRYLRESPAGAPDVLILSAKHGLISHDLPIATYDRQMTPARALSASDSAYFLTCERLEWRAFGRFRELLFNVWRTVCGRTL